MLENFAGYLGNLRCASPVEVASHPRLVHNTRVESHPMNIRSSTPATRNSSHRDSMRGLFDPAATLAHESIVSLAVHVRYVPVIPTPPTSPGSHPRDDPRHNGYPDILSLPRRCLLKATSRARKPKHPDVFDLLPSSQLSAKLDRMPWRSLAVFGENREPAAQ